MAKEIGTISSRFTVSKKARDKIDELHRKTGIPRFRLVNEAVLGLTDDAVDKAILSFEPAGAVAEKVQEFGRARNNELKSLIEDMKSSGEELPKGIKKDLDELIKG